MARFRAADLVVETKADATPVSDADRAAETALRARLAEARPADAVLGEEEGQTGSSGRRWVLDPIDGTKNYLRAIPVWATLIALELDGVPALGVVSAPALGRRWWAARGAGAFADGAPIHVSTVADVGAAMFSYDNLAGFELGGFGEAARELERRCGRSRGFGDFWSHVLVAEGSVDVAVEPAVDRWDVAAVQVVVEEAGGRFSDLRGRRRPDGGSAVSTNGLLHDEVLAVFGVLPGRQ